MDFDLRIPLGLLFLGIGALLALAGLVVAPDVFAARTGGLNIDLAWGGAMVVFGAAMLALGIRAHRRP